MPLRRVQPPENARHHRLLVLLVTDALWPSKHKPHVDERHICMSSGFFSVACVVNGSDRWPAGGISETLFLGQKPCKFSRIQEDCSDGGEVWRNSPKTPEIPTLASSSPSCSRIALWSQVHELHVAGRHYFLVVDSVRIRRKTPTWRVF